MGWRFIRGCSNYCLYFFDEGCNKYILDFVTRGETSSVYKNTFIICVHLPNLISFVVGFYELHNFCYVDHQSVEKVWTLQWVDKLYTMGGQAVYNGWTYNGWTSCILSARDKLNVSCGEEVS